MRIDLGPWVISLLVALAAAPVYAGWPDPDRTGRQKLLGISPTGSFALTDAEGEFSVTGSDNAYVVSVILDEKLAREIDQGFPDDLAAGSVFGIVAQQLYVFRAGSGFRAAATHAPMGGSLTEGSRPASGSILLGVDFLKALRANARDRFRLARALVVYHEMAHVLMMNRNIDRGSLANEAIADRLAGYCLGINAEELRRYDGIAVNESEITAVFAIKGFVSENNQLHGTPAVRIARIKEGYRLGRSAVTLDEALAELAIAD